MRYSESKFSSKAEVSNDYRSVLSVSSSQMNLSHPLFSGSFMNDCVLCTKEYLG